MSNVTMTDAGASFVATAGTAGIYFPLKYFTVGYDYRYDPYVLPQSELIPVSAGELPSATEPTGEIIWNIDNEPGMTYSITNNEFLLVYPGQTGTSTITDNLFDSTSNITLRNGVPLSDAISGSSIVYNSPDWNVTGYTLVNGDNDYPFDYPGNRDYFFETVSYAPVTCAAGGLSRGVYKIRLGNQVGNFKFNKINVYAAKYLADGTEDTSVDPVLFAVCMLNQPIIKSNDGSNINFFELELEIQISSSNYFGQISYLNNTDWNYVGSQNILWSDALVAIGSSAVPGSWQARAKLHITEPNPTIPMTRITNDNDNSYLDEFLLEFGQEQQHNYISSKPYLITQFSTSGDSDYTRTEFYSNANTMLRHIDMESRSSVSGTVNTGWFSQYEGYLEKSSFYFDNNTLLTVKSKSAGQYAKIIMGLGSDDLFASQSHLLTVYGGTLLVGGNTVSGDLAVTGEALIDVGLHVNGGIVTFGDFRTYGKAVADQGFEAYGLDQISIFDRIMVTTSAAFYGPVTINNDANITGNLQTDILYANNVTTTYGYISHLKVDYNSVLSGNLSVSATSFLSTTRTTVSADFQCPVSINGVLSVYGTLVAGVIDAAGSMSTPTFAADTGSFGTLFTTGNLNVSGLAAFGSNINIDNGDLLIRGAGKGVKINTTGTGPTAGRSLASGTSLVISTTSVASNSIIIYSLEETGSFVMASKVHTRTAGVSFTMMFESAYTGYVNWLIINPTP